MGQTRLFARPGIGTIVPAGKGVGGRSITADQMRCRTFLTAALLLGVGACTIERDISLYPAGTTSGTTVLRGKMIGHGEGHGTLEITMPDRELLQGEYSIVFNSSVGFGSIFGTVYGPRGAISGSSTSTNISMAGEGQGSASLVGNSGTSMQCEFLNANMTGHGYGACLTAKGKTYRMIY